jgi:Na+-driven multidrug efflux pump
VLKAEIASCWGFFVPVTLLVVLVLDWGMVIAWIVLGTYLTIYGTAVTVKFYKGKWKEVKV